jgi:hypothetical protein
VGERHAYPYEKAGPVRDHLCEWRCHRNSLLRGAASTCVLRAHAQKHARTRTRTHARTHTRTRARAHVDMTTDLPLSLSLPLPLAFSSPLSLPLSLSLPHPSFGPLPPSLPQPFHPTRSQLSPRGRRTHGPERTDVRASAEAAEPGPCTRVRRARPPADI